MNARYCAEVPRDSLLKNNGLCERLSELADHIEKGHDRNQREGAMRLREMEKSKTRTDLTRENKQKRNNYLLQVDFERRMGKIKDMTKNELKDQATLRGAKSHQNLSRDELIGFCSVHKKQTWAPSESGSSVSSGNSDVDSQGGYGSEDSNPVPKKKYYKRK